MNTKLKGRLGEEQAANYLKKKGYRILALGYSCRFGEIDIVARDGDTIAFVEVKLRKKTSAYLPREAVNYSKRQRLRATATLWLDANTGDELPARFDIVEIYADENGKAVRDGIVHIKDAFE